MITLDFETRSEADLKKVGAWAYSEHPSTDVICCCWAVDDGPVHEWIAGEPSIPQFGDEIIEAHNVAFERSIWQNVMTPRYGWPLPADDQWRDTMAVASYYALPPALDKLARVLGFGGKDPAGTRLISKYSKLHLKTAKREIPDEDLEKFVAYCRQDVELERAVSNFLGDLPDRELPVFLLDQRTNTRGLYLDLAGIEDATAVVEQRSKALTKEFRKLVGCNPTQLPKVKQWFAERGLELENMQAETLEEILEEGDLSQGDVRRAIEIRLAINKASTKKLTAMANARGRDGRARFQTRYHGAQTGRNTGAGLQPLNLNRGFSDDHKITPEQLVRDIGYRDPAWLDLLYGDAMDAIAKATRHWIRAAPGNRILAGDFVSVEAVILSCLAGEEWKIEAFRQGVKIYEMMADKIYNLPAGTVTKATHPTERQDGKTGELAFGYQGALNAWLNFDNSGRHTDERIIEICKAWRAEHPMIRRLWYNLEEQAIEAVRLPGTTTGYREIGFEVVDEWLSMILPNGKRIWYWHPELRMGMPQWHKPSENEDCKNGTCDCEPRLKLSYMAQKFGKWKRTVTYGGKLTENATQATSREVLVPAAMRAEKYGYPPILTVYDEIVAEVPIGIGSKEEFEEIMREPPPGGWADGWPINCDAWEGDRYRK